ncbi:hypothetical protein L1987_42344 [Smallanthus sonchifolius]|uniref:Uncharacterized protein n=1 Tax=Smallanthus sonchifolius TaxID=185202 RepID=A0ACB9GKJ6_9ASTR|nr:hypothetical protein L1987_42344 [Smallanthus sonchifolius]
MAGGGRGLDETATWSVALVCAVIVVLSIVLEKMLHHVGHYLKERRKIGLLEALEKIKTELMILGFISLLLTFCQNYIAAVCVSKVLTKDFLPCKKQPEGKPPLDDDNEAGNRRKLLWYDHRRLAGDGPPKECKPGYEALITVTGLHQLHIFIFFLAVFHVIYSALTMISGRAKIREWKVWEKDILQQQEIAHGTHAVVWLSLFPPVIILSVGTKLQGIITQMAIEIQEKHAVVQGIPLVQVTDKHFWFQDPTLILYFIQLTLFMLQHSSTFVTQMGSKMKRSIFDDQTSKALKHWHKNASKRRESKGSSSY